MGTLLGNCFINKDKSSKEQDSEVNNEKNTSIERENEKEDDIIFNPLNFSLNKIFSYEHNETIIDLKILKNGKIAILGRSYLNIYYLNIYKYNNEKIELQLSIERENNIVSFYQLSNEDIVICYNSHYMEIIKLIDEDKYKTIQKTKIKEAEICETSYRVVEIKKDAFILIIRNYRWESMKIWKLCDGINYQCITIFRGPLIYNALKPNEKEFTVLEYQTTRFKYKYEPILKFYNSKNYSPITKIKIKSRISTHFKPTLEDPHCELSNENMCLINEDLLGVGISCILIYLIKISSHELIKTIEFEDTNFYFGQINSILKHTNDLFILCDRIREIGLNKIDFNAIIVFKYDKENIEKVFIKKILISKNDDFFLYCRKLNDEIIVIYGEYNIVFLKLNT